MKRWVKHGARFLAVLLVSPWLLLFFGLASLGDRDRVFASFAQWLSLAPGTWGSYLRVAFYRYTMADCDVDAHIGFGALFSQQDTSIQEGAYIGPQCNVGRCRIGRNTLLGSGVHVLSGKGQHRFDNPDVPIKDQDGSFEKVTIGEDCWIGNGAIVMANVGDRCIVGAGSVVIQDLGPGAIAAGNPARVIRRRPEA